MNRWIDADELKNKVLEWMPLDPCGIVEKEFPFETDIVVSLLMEIEEAPSIDLVRCGECKYWNISGCHEGCGECEWAYYMTKPDDFCSYGERKESE